ncbi:MAG: Y-family DNA polymerase [Fibrobacterota bacterium]
MFALVDCNNFYASCERVFNPAVRGVPVIVLSNNDGCVIARSNEAKALGIPMGSPAFKLEKELKQHGVAVFSSNYALYGDLSERVMSILAEAAPAIEVYSIDEAFLDLKGFRQDALMPFAKQVRTKVRKWTGIPVSIGIAPTKTLAKAANRVAKKKHLETGYLILEDEQTITEVLESYDIDDLWGIGRRYSKFLKAHGIKTALQLRSLDDSWVQRHLTIMGLRMVHELRGIPCYQLEEHPPSKKNICNARSFGTAMESIDDISEAVATYAARCSEKLRKQASAANMITVFLETNRFKENEPQYFPYKVMSLPESTNVSTKLIQYALQGLQAVFRTGYRYKKAGVMVSGIIPANEAQLNLFQVTDHEKQKALMNAVDTINRTMGRDKVRVASQGFDRKWRLRQKKLSPCCTTQWAELLTVRV